MLIQVRKVLLIILEKHLQGVVQLLLIIPTTTGASKAIAKVCPIY